VLCLVIGSPLEKFGFRKDVPWGKPGD